MDETKFAVSVCVFFFYHTHCPSMEAMKTEMEKTGGDDNEEDEKGKKVFSSSLVYNVLAPVLLLLDPCSASCLLIK